MASTLAAAQPLRLAAQRPFQPLRGQRPLRLAVRAQVGGAGAVALAGRPNAPAGAPASACIAWPATM